MCRMKFEPIKPQPPVTNSFMDASITLLDQCVSGVMVPREISYIVRGNGSKCSARDSTLMAFLTFGEGYHNFHHEFQHDYRNGVKAWNFDPTKWAIWLLSKVGLVSHCRTVSPSRISNIKRSIYFEFIK